MRTGRISRRDFLVRAAGVAAFPYVARAAALGSSGAVAPSERVVMGFIGVGDMGSYHLQSFLPMDDVQVVAACDVRKIFRDEAKDRIDERNGDNACKVYRDFRDLLARGDIDAVTIATPEHWHGLIAIEAAKNRKAMYCEKPLDVNFAVSKAVRQAVHRYGVVFQLGCQQRSELKFRYACELARGGKLGKLHTIMVGSLTSGAFPNQPAEPGPNPDEFDYDRWLGPAPWKPYSYQRCASRAMGTPGWWTFIHDYSLGGISGAYGIHHIDIAQWGNGTDDTGPLEIEGTGVLPEDGLADTLLDWDVEMKYANGVRLLYMGTPTALKKGWQFRSYPYTCLAPGCAVLFEGSAGWVIVGRRNIYAEPQQLLKGLKAPRELNLYGSIDHRRNFIDCVKSGSTTICPVDTAVRSDVICHLSDIAIRLGRKLRWDPAREECLADDAANRMLSRPMRSPWHL